MLRSTLIKQCFSDLPILFASSYFRTIFCWSNKNVTKKGSRKKKIIFLTPYCHTVREKIIEAAKRDFVWDKTWKQLIMEGSNPICWKSNLCLEITFNIKLNNNFPYLFSWKQLCVHIYNEIASSDIYLIHIQSNCRWKKRLLVLLSIFTDE